MMSVSKVHDILKALGVMLLIGIFTLAILTFSLCNDDFPNGNKIVYTTDTGECYHLKNCPTLKYSKYQTTIEEAVEDGYISCGWCESPVLKGKNGFSYEWYFYLIVVPFSAAWSWAATNGILKYSDIHYVIPLVINFILAGLIDLIF